MQTFHFGDPAQPLLGVYHPPTGLSGGGAVLLCYPCGHEHSRAHWAFRCLAGKLSQAGFHVMRFDYTGTGDSAGDCGEGDAEQWREDVLTAADELRAISGLSALSLVGLRLGATLAAAAVRDCRPVRDLVLWDPVVRGAHLLEQYHAMSRARDASLPQRGKGEPMPESAGELLGFPWPETARHAVKQFDLLALTSPWQVRQVALLLSEEREEYGALLEHLRETCPSLVHRVVPMGARWDDWKDMEHPVMARETLGEIVSVLSRRPS